MDNRNETMITKLEEMISNLESKNFKMYFFVIDTKGNPHGGVEYMYDIALEMHNNGYDVTMLHQEQEFVGPFDWLGERYSVLPHENVEASNVPISATDFLFIPEVYSNVMIQTKELPCRRVVVCRNPEFMLEFIPVGASWFDFGIYDDLIFLWSSISVIPVVISVCNYIKTTRNCPVHRELHLIAPCCILISIRHCIP